MGDILTYDASYFNNDTLNARARSSAPYYRREATNVLISSMEDATKLGTLTKNETQLDVTAQVSRANPDSFYTFTLDGDSLKLNLSNYTGTADLRIQIMDSTGKVVSDNSTFASASLKIKHALANSSSGLDLKAGEYYAKISYDVDQLKGVAQAYQLALYSGTSFSSSYSTVAASQIKASQHVSIDDTMVFSTLDAMGYSNEDIHRVNATADTAINIGWLYENKTALSVSSMLTDICDEQYYSVTLQKGEALKFALDEKTGTAGIRVQIMDPTGTYVHADSHGTDKQKAAYAELTSSSGMDASRGQYLIKVSFEQGANKSEDQNYNFKVYAGNYYANLYKTLVTTETRDTALLQGSFTAPYDPITALASYMEAYASGSTLNVIATLQDNV